MGWGQLSRRDAQIMELQADNSRLRSVTITQLESIITLQREREAIDEQNHQLHAELKRLRWSDAEHTKRLVSADELEPLIEAYLTDRHCTIWGRAFDVIHPDSKKLAVKFIIDLLNGLDIKLNRD